MRGISKLTGALDADQLHDLKTVLDAMADRLEGYNSFAGAPDGADGSVKFVYKTAETVAAADTTAAETETVKGRQCVHPPVAAHCEPVQSSDFSLMHQAGPALAGPAFTPAKTAPSPCKMPANPV